MMINIWLRLSLNQIRERHLRVIPKAKLGKGGREMIGTKAHRRGYFRKTGEAFLSILIGE